MINANQTGEKISKLRKEQNLTQKELAERLHVTSAAVSKWERGLNFPDLLLLGTVLLNLCAEALTKRSHSV